MSQLGEQTTNKASHQKGGGSGISLVWLGFDLEVWDSHKSPIFMFHVGMQFWQSFVKKSFGGEVPAGD
jgi:hypothetical protein